MSRFTSFAAALLAALAVAAGAWAGSPAPSAPFTGSHSAAAPGAAFAARYGPSRAVVMRSCMTDDGSPANGGGNPPGECACVTGVVMRVLPHLGGTQVTTLAGLFLHDQFPGYAWQDIVLWMPHGYLSAYFHCTGATYPIKLGATSS